MCSNSGDKACDRPCDIDAHITHTLFISCSSSFWCLTVIELYLRFYRCFIITKLHQLEESHDVRPDRPVITQSHVFVLSKSHVFIFANHSK